MITDVILRFRRPFRTTSVPSSRDSEMRRNTEEWALARMQRAGHSEEFDNEEKGERPLCEGSYDARGAREGSHCTPLKRLTFSSRRPLDMEVDASICG